MDLVPFFCAPLGPFEAVEAYARATQPSEILQQLEVTNLSCGSSSPRAPGHAHRRPRMIGDSLFRSRQILLSFWKFLFRAIQARSQEGWIDTNTIIDSFEKFSKYGEIILGICREMEGKRNIEEILTNMGSSPGYLCRFICVPVDPFK